jgi:hypothetical protein
MNDIKFYMQECDKNGVLRGVRKNLEADFDGLRYMEAKGISKVGKVKNVYTEQYSDSNTLRTWHPSENGEETTHEATIIELKLLFYGEHRRESYDEFNKYIRDGYLMYWDTLRGKKFMFMVIDSIDPSDDNF